VAWEFRVGDPLHVPEMPFDTDNGELNVTVRYA